MSFQNNSVILANQKPTYSCNINSFDKHDGEKTSRYCVSDLYFYFKTKNIPPYSVLWLVLVVYDWITVEQINLVSTIAKAAETVSPRKEQFNVVSRTL